MWVTAEEVAQTFPYGSVERGFSTERTERKPQDEELVDERRFVVGNIGARESGVEAIGSVAVVIGAQCIDEATFAEAVRS